MQLMQLMQNDMFVDIRSRLHEYSVCNYIQPRLKQFKTNDRHQRALYAFQTGLVARADHLLVVMSATNDPFYFLMSMKKLGDVYVGYLEMCDRYMPLVVVAQRMCQKVAETLPCMCVVTRMDRRDYQQLVLGTL